MKQKMPCETLNSIINLLTSKDALLIIILLLITAYVSKDLFMILLGGFISFFFIIWMEHKRLPKIELSISCPNPLDVNFNDIEGKLINQVKSLRINVENKKLDSWWLTRYPASRCYGYIMFYDIEGTKMVESKMEIRWVATHQPIPIRGEVNGKAIVMYDLERLIPQSYMDIHPGNTEIIDVAVRPINDGNCYGFCNESYFSKGLLSPKWKMGLGQFIVKIELMTPSNKIEEVFRLLNQGGNGVFELADALPGDMEKIIR
jgi:hypothetical protein